jgi:hypothetical protein
MQKPELLAAQEKRRGKVGAAAFHQQEISLNGFPLNGKGLIEFSV